MEPDTGYAVLDHDRIAYQLIGSGPPDLVITPGWFSAFDIEWEEPSIKKFLQRVASFSRVIRFDRRGSGASDPIDVETLPPWESFAEDIACVMDAVASESSFLWGDGDAGPLSILYAATHPDRVQGLILFHTTARFLSDTNYDFGMPAGFVDEVARQFEQDWGTGEGLAGMVPSRADDPDFKRWLAKLMRATTTPSAVRRYMEGVVTADVREILPKVDVPALVLHPATQSQVLSIEHARYLVDHLPNGHLVELTGPADVFPAFDLADQVVSAIQEFITGIPPPPRAERALATVLFTDIVSSTARAFEVGDHRWRELLDEHDDLVRREIGRYSGRLVKTTGDGILATFDGPGRAVEFASMLHTALSRIGIAIRAGIHTGEIEKRGEDIGGVAVHLGARIMAIAAPGEILVSRTVKDLVIGSSLTLDDRGTHQLKGVEGEWQVYSVRP